MIYEVQGNLIDHWHAGNMIGITTNGFVKNDGRAVMGAGIAKTIRNALPGFDLSFGSQLTKRGNVPMINDTVKLFTFPVKHNWYEKADLELIAKSAETIASWKWERYDFPRPGCGNGKLTWDEVRPILDEAFDGLHAYVWDFA